jgi:hypothetical protein
MNKAAVIETNYPAPTSASNSGDVKDSLWSVLQQIEQSDHTKVFNLLGGYVCAL